MSDFILGILGCAGGLLCAAGDILFDLKGKGNVKTGPSKLIDSNWLKMPEWRFRVSILLAAAGVPLYLLGFLGMSRQLALSNETLATVFLVFAVVGASGGFFIHALVCSLPIINKTLVNKGVSADVMDAVAEKLFGAVKIPFMTMFCSLVVATSVTLMAAIVGGALSVPKVFLVLNPFVLMLIGWLFRLIDRERFADLPGIIMPSVGTAMIGVMTAVSAM